MHKLFVGAAPLFYCTKCQRSYTQQHSLYVHIKYDCGKLPTICCDKCNYRTKRKEHLKRNMYENRHRRQEQFLETATNQRFFKGVKRIYRSQGFFSANICNALSEAEFPSHLKLAGSYRAYRPSFAINEGLHTHKMSMKVGNCGTKKLNRKSCLRQATNVLRH